MINGSNQKQQPPTRQDNVEKIQFDPCRIVFFSIFSQAAQHFFIALLIKLLKITIGVFQSGMGGFEQQALIFYRFELCQ